MQQRGFTTILWALVVVVLGVGAYFFLPRQIDLGGQENPGPTPVACTADAKICPDGSAVGRTGPNCEFADCPTPGPKPKPVPGPDTSGQDCAGPSDNSCGAGYECISKCGPPVARQDDPPPGYYCQLDGYVQMCPICLALNTLIDSPHGQVPVQDLEVGVQVWTINKVGKKVAVPIEKVSKTQVPSMHKVVHLILSDGRELFVSPGHPAVNGRIVGDFVPNDIYEGASVVSAELVAYEYEFTYDILAAGSTGFYFANGILLDSTLH